MTRWLCLLAALVACDVKQPVAPSYFHAQPRYYPSCQDTVACYPQCNPPSEECMTACDAKTTPPTAESARTLESCLRDARCSDEACAKQYCFPQLTACTDTRIEAGSPAQQPPR